MIWTSELESELVRMRAEGRSYAYMAAMLFGHREKRGAIAGKLARIDGRVAPRHQQKLRKRTHERKSTPNSWDQRLFEPWAEYTARKKLERLNAMR